MLASVGSMTLWIATALVVIAGPVLFGLVGWIRAPRSPAATASDGAVPWKLTICSALLYVLAFNLTFFIQELFLVLPKAFTPGLRPTLFHNNHRWEGEHPLASLFQGTGVLAIFISGVICALLLRRVARTSVELRLFLIWMAYSGFFQALPQIVIGAMSPNSDVGMAMNYLRLDATAKTIAALAALAAMPPIALSLTRSLLAVAAGQSLIASMGARTRFIFRVAALPAIIAIPLIVLFRVPRELIEVVALPVVVTTIGIAWMQALAWRIEGVRADGRSPEGSVAYPLGAVLLLLFVFQVLLRPGVAFY